MNNRRELEILEVDLDQARLRQEVKGEQARLRAGVLKAQQDAVKAFLVSKIPENLDAETMQEIINDFRKTINDLNI